MNYCHVEYRTSRLRVKKRTFEKLTYVASGDSGNPQPTHLQTAGHSLVCSKVLGSLIIIMQFDFETSAIGNGYGPDSGLLDPIIFGS